MSTDNDLSPTRNTDGGLNPTVGAPEQAAPSVAQLLMFITQQNARMESMMAMMQHDRPEVKAERLANVRLDERHFRNVPKYSKPRSSWKEWKRQFMAPVRECDVDFGDFVWEFEGREEPTDHIRKFNLTQNQFSTNMYKRLIALTTGTAFQIMESVPHFNGIEAWRLMIFQYDPKTDARLTYLVLSIIGHKIKGEDVQVGLVLWKAQLLALERDHQETLSPKIKRAFLMNVLPTGIQTRVMEHLDRLKTYREVREKVVTFCHNVDDADIGNVDDVNYSRDSWEGWWRDDFRWHEPEVPGGLNPAGDDPDIQGLADMKCHVCGGLGHMARNCTTSNPKGGGKGGKAGPANGGKARVEGSPKGLGKALRNSHLWCTTCK